jgi:hypothetical protein
MSLGQQCKSCSIKVLRRRQKLIGRDGNWKKVSVAEARKFVATHLIHWRPEYLRASIDLPDQDEAYVLDEEKETTERKRK